MHRVDVDVMLDEMSPEQMMEWMAYMMLRRDDSGTTSHSDPATHEMIIKKAMGF